MPINPGRAAIGVGACVLWVAVATAVETMLFPGSDLVRWFFIIGGGAVGSVATLYTLEIIKPLHRD